MVEVTRRRLIAGGSAIVVGSIATAVVLRDDLAISLEHEFDTSLTVDIDVSRTDDGIFILRDTVEVAPGEAERIEFVEEFDSLNVSVIADRGLGGSTVWDFNSQLAINFDEDGPHFDGG